MDLHRVLCPNPACSDKGPQGRGNSSIHRQTTQRYRCAPCGKTVTATRGMALYRLHHAVDLMVLVLVVTLRRHSCLDARRAGRRHVALSSAGLALMAVAFVLFPSLASACARDGVPSVSANGRLAVVNRAAAPAVLTTWAPFVFARPIQRGRAVTLAENNREISNAHVLPADVFKHPWRWTFGDGRPAAYGTRVHHTYRKTGTYRIEVRAYYAAYASWQPFDVATIHVR